MDILQSSESSGIDNFLAYIQKHRHRIPCYRHFHDQAIPIGSGAVESLVKQIDRRGQISGAQWASKNVPQVLKHRCAYLNGFFSLSLPKHIYSLQN